MTPGNAHNSQIPPELLEKDMAQGIPVETMAGAQAYDNGKNHFLIESKGLNSAIRLPVQENAW